MPAGLIRAPLRAHRRQLRGALRDLQVLGGGDGSPPPSGDPAANRVEVRRRSRDHRTSSTSTRTTRAATSSRTGTRCRPRTSRRWPTRASSSGMRSARSPTCSGTPARLLTGQYCHNNGMLGLAHRGLVAERLRPAPGPPAARGRLPLDPDRRAAHLHGPERHRLRPRRRGRHPSRAPRSPRRDRGCCAELPPSRSSCRSASSRPTASSTRPTLGARRALLAAAAPTCPTRPRPARTWPRSRPAPARSTRASARC